MTGATSEATAVTGQQQPVPGTTTPLQLALNHLEKAADFFESEQSPASAAACRDKRARIEADGGQLDRAADGFLKLADWAASDSMLSSCVTDYAFKACLCELAAASRSDRLQSGLRHLGRSDEADLVKALAGATSVAAFDEALIAFQRFNNVDDWCERRLKEVKLRIGHSKKHSLV
ncbi:hypothetical protein BOX15_Mlig019747g4 [Macrostomum lignano]|nr:hypothetical protein BOX15_Mlig019747g4 [Macrostomum lignano]